MRRRNPRITRVVLRHGNPYLRLLGYSAERARTDWCATAYDEDGHMRSMVNDPSRAYVERKCAEWFPGVQLEESQGES